MTTYILTLPNESGYDEDHSVKIFKIQSSLDKENLTAKIKKELESRDVYSEACENFELQTMEEFLEETDKFQFYYQK